MSKSFKAGGFDIIGVHEGRRPNRTCLQRGEYRVWTTGTNLPFRTKPTLSFASALWGTSSGLDLGSMVLPMVFDKSTQDS